MTQVIEQIIRLNVELEGALRVAAARHSDEALTAAAEKLEQINSLFSELKASEAPESSSENSENSECSEAAATEPAATVIPEAEPIAAVEAIEAVEAPVAATEPAAPAFRDIRKNITINDKFLFKRELFNGSNEEFNDTLDLISTMHSLAEAEEYLYEDMALDPDNESVKDFIALVTNYFNQK